RHRRRSPSTRKHASCVVHSLRTATGPDGPACGPTVPCATWWSRVNMTRRVYRCVLTHAHEPTAGVYQSSPTPVFGGGHQSSELSCPRLLGGAPWWTDTRVQNSGVRWRQNSGVGESHAAERSALG